MSIQQEKFKEIANAIRTVMAYPDEQLIKPNDFASMIDTVHSHGLEYGEYIGFDKGYAQGYEDGYDESLDDIYNRYFDGFNAGFDVGMSEGTANGIIQGKQQKTEEFVNMLTNNGAKTNFSYAFYQANMSDEMCTDIFSYWNATIKNALNMFYGAKNIVNGFYTDKLDFSQCQSLNQTFSASHARKFKKIDARATTKGNNGANGTFGSCNYLESIDEYYPSTSASFQKTFDGCSSLAHIIFRSEITINGLNLQWSPLNVESLKSILDNLADKSTDTSGTTWKVTVGSTNYATILDNLSSELEQAIAKGWDIE